MKQRLKQIISKEISQGVKDYLSKDKTKSLDHFQYAQYLVYLMCLDSYHSEDLNQLIKNPFSNLNRLEETADYENAINLYKNHLKNNDFTNECYLGNFGDFLQAAQFFKEAIKIYKLDLDEYDLRDIAECYEKLQDYANALKFYKRALKQNPKDESLKLAIEDLIRGDIGSK